MRIVEDTAFALRVASQWLGVKFSEPCIGLLVLDDENKRPAGAVVLNNYSERNIDVSVVGLGCWTPQVIRDLARYVFVKLKCRRVTAVTRASNLKAMLALESLGFVQEGVAPDWFEDGETAIRYGLTAARQRIIRA